MNFPEDDGGDQHRHDHSRFREAREEAPDRSRRFLRRYLRPDPPVQFAGHR